jgi:protease-4
LIDAVERWDAQPRWLRESKRARPAPREWLAPERLTYDEVWGPALKIPVVYAVGECAMDTGIKGRTTSQYLRRLINDPNVAAVVLRADSPGGDPLPSDLVADAVRQLRKAGKPVIVSQGDVAASGGYWISMDGTSILTTPLTITGSIGVISGWVWDDGLGEKMGVTADAVSRGRHADLYANIKFPFLGALPRRPMNDEELQRAESLIRGMYDDFLGAVAAGRNLDKDAVHEVAQGRVWMGGDAIEHGLCDSMGGLGDAIALARKEAGVPDWRKVQLVEYPPRKLFQFPSLFPSLPGLGWVDQQIQTGIQSFFESPTQDLAHTYLPPVLPGLDGWETQYLKHLSRDAGEPQLVLPPESLPAEWRMQEGAGN